MPKCVGRRTFLSLRRHFGDGVHWVYGEAMCDRVLEGNVKVCEVCRERGEGTAKLQAQPGYPHGVCGEEVPVKSQIYGGAWYKEGVKKWGEPSADDLKFLEEARQKVMNTLDQYFGKKKDDDMIIKKMREANLNDEAEAAEPAPAPKKRKAGGASRKKKEIVPVDASKDSGSDSTGIIVAMEVDEEEIIPEEMMEVSITSITIGGKEYYFDGEKGKVYMKAANGEIGDYVGRLHGGKIVGGIPDSDEEECV